MVNLNKLKIMPENPLHPALQALTTALDSLTKKVVDGWADNRTMMDNWGWNFPALDRHELGRVASDLAKAIRDRGSESLEDPMLQTVKQAKIHVDQVRDQVVVNFYNGHGHQAVPIYLSLLDRLKADLDPLLGWQSVRDTNLLPAKLAKRLRSYHAQLDQIAPDKDALARNLKLITEATEAAESLPTDLAALTAARNEVERLQREALSLHQKITGCLDSAEQAFKKLRDREGEAAKLVGQCEEAYRITTTKGLAAAFSQRATSLSTSMWIWVVGLVVALGVGYFLGKARLDALTKVLDPSSQQAGVVWPNAIMALISLGGPIWFA